MISDHAPSSPESPVFRGKVKGSNKNCIRDDDTEPTSSPWLSKEQEITNGAASTSAKQRYDETCEELISMSNFVMCFLLF